MDLSKLSDADLDALERGDLSKVSDEGLDLLEKMSAKKPGIGTPMDAVSGFNRGVVGTIGDALVAGYNLMLPESQHVQPLSTGMRQAGIDLDRPRSLLGMAGEYAMPGPGGLLRNVAQTGLAATGGYLGRQVAPDSVAAEMVGAVAAPMSIPGVQAGIRGLFRGADPTQMAETVARADSLGAPLTVGTASKNQKIMTLERMSGSVLGGVNQFREAGKKAAEAIKTKLVSLTGGEADDVVKAGKTIEKGLFDPESGWMRRSINKGQELYTKLDEKFALHDWFAERGTPTDPGFLAINTRRFAMESADGVKGAPAVTELLGDPSVQGRINAFVADLDSGNGRVPYAAMKQMRTDIGDALGDPQLIGSAKRNTLKDFYSALSNDMESAAERVGATKEFNRANAYHKARIARVEDFYESLHKKTTPEEVWNAAFGDTPKSASRISAIRKGLKPEEWNYLRRTLITRMGDPVASAAKEGGTNFSAGTFLTRYQQMKDKGVLTPIFGSGQYRKDLDDVAKYASDLRESAEVLSNPSGTAGLGLAASVYYGALGMIGMGLGGAPMTGLIGIGSGLVANNVVARLMNNQRFVHWLARSTKIPPSDMANHLKRLPLIVGNDPNDLEDVQEFLNAINQ